MRRTNLFKLAVLAVIAVVCIAALGAMGGSPLQAGEANRGPIRTPGPVQEGRPMAMPVTPTPPLGGPNFFSVSAVAFRPLRPDYAWNFQYEWLYNPGPGEAIYAAPVALPHQATVTKFVVYFMDYGDGGPELTASLARCTYDQNTCLPMAAVTSSGTDSGYRSMEDDTIVFSEVNNQANWYVVEVQLPPGPAQGLLLRSVRVDYGFDTELPAVMRGSGQ